MKRNKKKILNFIIVSFVMLVVFTSNIFATNDPLSVINNLSNLLFSFMRVIGTIMLGLRNS